MNKLLDKLVILLFCLVFHIQNSSGSYIIVPVIIAITLSAVNSIRENHYFMVMSLAGYIFCCVLYPDFIFFIPLLAYDILLSKWQYLVLLAVLVWAANPSRISSLNALLIGLFIALTWLIKYRTNSIDKIRHEYVELRDSAQEFSLQLKSKNSELMARQDYEINLATLQERNRIAREIHDHVGHQLSSSILQIAALISKCQDESCKEGLNTLNSTLAQAMNSIRDSIHDLHDESLDLYSASRELIDNFAFCPVVLDYDIESNPDKRVKYAFIAIMKEALANIMKHSDAGQVHITLREHPALYQLMVRDNGSKRAVNEGGIGLNNIMDRVSNLGGNINISSDNGFSIFISVPREVTYENSDRR